AAGDQQRDQPGAGHGGQLALRHRLRPAALGGLVPAGLDEHHVVLVHLGLPRWGSVKGGRWVPASGQTPPSGVDGSAALRSAALRSAVGLSCSPGLAYLLTRLSSSRNSCWWRRCNRPSTSDSFCKSRSLYSPVLSRASASASSARAAS